MNLHFESYGQGEPLVILHGLLGSADNWHSIATKLASHFRVYTLDQRNHGHSPHSSEMDYSLLAQDAHDFIKSQGLADALVLGHSMGGKTAMQMALLYPRQVRRLVVVDIAPRGYAPRHWSMLQAMASLDLAHSRTRSELESALAPVVADLSTRQFLLKNAVRTETGHFDWRIGLRQIIQNYSRLTEALNGERPFDKPTLFIRGQKSDFLFESDLPDISRLFPRARLRTIPAAGHLVHVQNAEAFLKVVLEFLCLSIA